jgi:cell division protein FtsI (penicillin-binding protein 3)
MALDVGAEYQYEFLEKLGLLDRINDYGIRTNKSLYREKSQWYYSPSTVATIAYGYGLSVSPLHLISAYSAIINGGLYHKPSFECFNNKEEVRVISKEVSKQMKELLRSVVVNGSGKRANIEGLEVTGKTGTANKLDAQGKYDKNKVRTTFLGSFKYKDKEYTILVILEEPQPIEETHNFLTAGWNAVPTTKEIIEVFTE